jgi:hypothetical protein
MITNSNESFLDPKRQLWLLPECAVDHIAKPHFSQPELPPVCNFVDSILASTKCKWQPGQRFLSPEFEGDMETSRHRFDAKGNFDAA